MKKILAICLIMSLCMVGVACAQDGKETVRFSWEHDPPTDMSHYTIYEFFGPGGNPTGTELVVPYVDGTVPPFISDQQITLPCDIPTERCYVVTASDKNDNESDPSNEACKLMTSDCDPGTPANFQVDFPVIPAP